MYGAPLARDLLPLDLHQGPSAAQERLALGPDDGPAFAANVSAPLPLTWVPGQCCTALQV